jgi:mannonate dehydratase
VPVRLAIGVPSDASDDGLRFASQLGCTGVVWPAPRIPGEHRWEYEDLVQLRERTERVGLRLEAIQTTPATWVADIQLGGPERDRQIDHYAATVRNIGRAGISVLAYNWRPNQLYRTGPLPGRGGARVTAFDAELARGQPLSFGRVYSAEEMWASYEHFVRTVIPVAREAGIRLALHPDDPPNQHIGGVARIFGSLEAFERASRIVESPAWGLLSCTGCWAEMAGGDYVLRAIRHFGARRQIAYVHFRDVQGHGDRFNECFIGEGPSDITAWLRALKQVDFDGPVIGDHTPRMVGDEGWSPRGRAFQTGYIAGMLRVLDDLS